MIEEMIDAICSLILGLIPTGVKIEPFPDNIAEVSRNALQPAIWVALDSVEGGAELNAYNLVQQSTVRFEVILKSPTLRGTNGIYSLYENCLKALMGKRPATGTGQLRHVKLAVNAKDNALFDYSFYVECPNVMIVEHFDTAAGNGAILVDLEFKTPEVTQKDPVL